MSKIALFIMCGRAARGHTAVELLATLSLIALVTTLALPAMGELLVRHRLAAVSNDFLALLMLARHEAMHRGRRVTVCRTNNPEAALPSCAGPGASWAEGVMAFVDAGTRNPPQPADAAAILRITGAVDARAQIVRKGLTTPSFSFAANGRLKSGTFGVSFHITPVANSPEQRWLCVAMTGRMRVIKQTCE